MARKKDATAEIEVVEEADQSRAHRVLAGAALAAITKKHGSSVLFLASDEHYQTVPRIPTNILKLDWALGGGWPAGRINLIYGHKSASKTSTLLRTIGNAQKMCANCFKVPDSPKCCGKFREMVCAFIDVEGALDHAWAQKLGVDLERLIYCRPEFAEQALDICEALVQSGDVDVVVLDSLAYLTPSKEIEESIEKETMGVQARMIGKAMRKLNAALSAMKNERGQLVTIFFTNQIRMKVGLVFGSPETVPGGLSPGFAATTEVKVWPGKYDIDEETGCPRSVEMNFRVEKNKSYRPKMEGAFRMMLSDMEHKKEGQIYDEDAAVKLCEQFKLAEGHGNSWTCLGEKFGGKRLIEERLLTDPEFRAKVYGSLMQVLLAI